jgi:hypothetical protein
MAKSLYSAYMSAGKSAGQYKASLFETSDWADKFDFIGKQTAWEQEKTSRLVGTIGDTLSLASTIGGGLQDKQKTQARAESLEGKYGKLQTDTRGWEEKGMDWLMGKERTYTFGEGDSATTLSKAAVSAQGAIAMGESMLGEYEDKFYGNKEPSSPSFDIPPLDLNQPEFGKSFASTFSSMENKPTSLMENQPTNTNSQNYNPHQNILRRDVF